MVQENAHHLLNKREVGLYWRKSGPTSSLNAKRQSNEGKDVCNELSR